MTICGQPPVKSGKIASGKRKTVVLGYFPMEKLHALQRTPTQEAHYRVLMNSLNMCFGVNNEKLQAVKSLQQACEAVNTFIQNFFPPTNLQFVKSGAPDRLCDLALEENRLLYIPARDSQMVFASGNTQKDSIDIYSFKPEQLGLADFALPEGLKCMIAIPLVSMTKQKYGAILLSSAYADIMDPLVELPILRMIASSLAAAMQVNGFVL
jgi:hypothetical protein